MNPWLLRPKLASMMTNDESVNLFRSSLKSMTKQHRQLEMLHMKLCDELKAFKVPPLVDVKLWL